MTIQFKLMELRPQLGNTMPYAQIYQQLLPYAQRAGLLMPNREEGYGYLQWSLPGDDWTSLNGTGEDIKATVVAVYNERHSALAEALKNVPMRDALLSVPSEREILFRRNGDGWDIALVAWGYKYPNQRPTGPLVGYESPKVPRQQVNIGFMWDGQLLPNVEFLLNNQKRQTGDDGLFHVDKPLEVGSSYEITYCGNMLWMLSVVMGQEDYVRDLTKYVDVVVFVTADEQPVAGETCTVGFSGKEHTIVTDDEGRATVRLPLVADSQGQILDEQPPCKVTCRDAEQMQAPDIHHDTLGFDFDFTVKKPYVAPDVEEKEKEKPEQQTAETVHLRLLDYGGCPMSDLDFVLHTKKKGDVTLKTDADGHYAVPKDWLVPGEKVKIRLAISSDYQNNHDLHDPKKSKKKEKS